MSAGQKIGLLANLNAMKAQQRLHLGLFEPTDYEGVFALYLTAYGDIELAHKAKSKAAELYAERRTNEATRQAR